MCFMSKKEKPYREGDSLRLICDAEVDNQVHVLHVSPFRTERRVFSTFPNVYVDPYTTFDMTVPAVAALCTLNSRTEAELRRGVT